MPPLDLTQDQIGTPLWMVSARAHLGLQEGKGDVDNPEVLKLFKAMGAPNVKHDSTPWCAAFVGAVLEDNDIVSTRSLGARSYETWGRRLVTPLYGCVGVKRRPAAALWTGHVGFVVGANARSIFLLGGNQGDKVSIACFPREQFTAFRWPSTVPLPVAPAELPQDILLAERFVTQV